MIAIGSAIAGIAVTVGWFVNIPIAGAIVGVVAGFVLSNYTQTRTQRRAWKREFMLKAVELVYGRLYNETSKISKTFNDAKNNRSIPYNYEDSTWHEIRDSYLYYMLEDPLRNDVQVLFNKIDEYDEVVFKARTEIEKITGNRGSQIFVEGTHKIYYDVKTPIHPHGVSCHIDDNVLRGVHPLQDYSQAEPSYFEVQYVSDAGSKTQRYNSEEDFKRFEEFWKLVSEDADKNPSIVRMKQLLHEIPVINATVAKKLVGKIQEQWKV